MQDTPITARWLRRTFLGLPIVGWLVLAVVGTAIAVIGFVVYLPVGGSVSTGDGIDITYVGDTSTAQTNAAIGSCTISNTSDEVTISATDMLANEYCYFEVDVTNNGAANAVFQRYNLQPNGTNGLYANADGTIGGDWCNTLIPVGGADVTIGFQITFDENTVPGFTHNLVDPNEDNLKFVRQELYVAGDCF